MSNRRGVGSGGGGGGAAGGRASPKPGAAGGEAVPASAPPPIQMSRRVLQKYDALHRDLVAQAMNGDSSPSCRMLLKELRKVYSFETDAEVCLMCFRYFCRVDAVVCEGADVLIRCVKLCCMLLLWQCHIVVMLGRSWNFKPCFCDCWMHPRTQSH